MEPNILAYGPMGPMPCQMCGTMCRPEPMHSCAACGIDSGAVVYYWPCRRCSNECNGSQCENKMQCMNAILARAGRA